MYSTSTGAGMCCLADIREWFEEDREPIEVGLYSGVDYTEYYEYRSGEREDDWRGGQDWAEDRVQDHVSHIIQDVLPSSIWRTKTEKMDAIRTGMVTMRWNQSPTTLHSKLAAFRIAIERPDSMDFYEQGKKYGPMGAWIASHCYQYDDCEDSRKWMRVSGWHQSMFCDLFPTPKGMTSSKADPRRVAALYPRYRQHLEGPPPTISSQYWIPELKERVWARIQDAYIMAGLTEKQIPDPNRDMQGVVEYFQLWHDTIVHTLEVAIP